MANRPEETSLDRTIREHAELRGMIRELHGLLSPPGAAGGSSAEPSPAAFFAKVGALHDMLSEHFGEEEKSGLPEELALRLPHVADRAEALKGEHVRLLDDLRALVSKGHGGGASGALGDPKVRAEARSILDRIQHHEENETDLIQKAYFDDVGAAD